MSGAGISRAKAFLAMQSPLGPEALIPSALTVEEAISEPFLATVDVLSSEADIDPDKLLYHAVCITLRRPEREPRHVHGFVRRFVITGSLPRSLFGYRLEVVPKLWFLSQTGDCRVFENKSTKDIVQTLCSEGSVDVEFRVSGPSARPFTVQYNETDLAFATRLIEEEGWFYLFKHTEAAHKLIIADSESAFTNVPRGDVTRRPGEGPDVLATWQPGRATAHGKIALADYDPKQPATVLSGETNTQLSTSGAPKRDLFQWPARTLQNESVRQRTRQRIEAAEAEALLAEGSGFHEGFIPGGRIQVSPHVGGEPTRFVLRRVRHEATDATWDNAAAPPAYRNGFSAFPANTRWRPQPTVPRPRMDGLYSAVVIGARRAGDLRRRNGTGEASLSLGSS